MKNGLGAVLFLLVTVLAGAQHKNPVINNTTETIQLRGKVLANWQPQQFSAEVVPVDVDPRFVLKMRVVSAIPPVPEFEPGTVVNFAIHSPTLVFRDDPQVNKTYEFVLCREIGDGKVKFSGLRVEEERGLEKETQTLGYWVDPSTGLMWAGKDNGDKEVNWHKSVKYCRNLRLAGYTDWTLATIDELQGIYDKNAESPGENPRSRWHDAEPMTYHVMGGLFLNGDQWSSTQLLDDRGRPSGYAWRFDFNEGRRFGGDELWFYTNKHALCVRSPGK